MIAAQLQDANHPQDVVFGSHADRVEFQPVALGFDEFCGDVLRGEFHVSGRVNEGGGRKDILLLRRMLCVGNDTRLSLRLETACVARKSY